MKTSKPILFCALILGILSATQMDVFARGEPHGHFRPEVPHDDASKLHTFLGNHGEPTSGAVTSRLKKVTPEVVTLQGRVSEDVVGAAHPESQVVKGSKKAKPRVSCTEEPGNPNCFK